MKTIAFPGSKASEGEGGAGPASRAPRKGSPGSGTSSPQLQRGGHSRPPRGGGEATALLAAQNSRRELARAGHRLPAAEQRQQRVRETREGRRAAGGAREAARRLRRRVNGVTAAAARPAQPRTPTRPEGRELKGSLAAIREYLPPESTLPRKREATQ